MRRFSASLVLAVGLCFPASVLTADMIAGGDFDGNGDAFWASGGVSLSHEHGKLCAAVPAGGESWDHLLGLDGLVFTLDTPYRLAMSVDSSEGRSFPVVVQRGEKPWTAQARFDVSSTSKPHDFAAIFRARETQPAQIIFQLGGATRPWRLCLDDVTLREADPGEVATMATPSADGLIGKDVSHVPALPDTAGGPMPVRVNQMGYFTDGPKRATIMTPATEPLAFTLVTAAGAVVGEGTTASKGYDDTARSGTQIADFTAFRSPGTGYRIVVDGKPSHPFSIADGLYEALRVDALSWFYPQRSGIEIEAGIAGAAYARPAGHAAASPHGGDSDVACLSGPEAAKLYGKWVCGYRLDVTGGWYDAGDHGKYAVTGAIAAAQLLASFERGKTYGGAASPVVGDGPERGNGIPGLLDEAKWELDFLLKMMVPKGQPLAGMVHHKVHDEAWTDLPLLPHQDGKMRFLHRPSTAATLDFAAVAAQGARLFAAHDAAYSKRLLAAANTAWLAAAANPVLHAPKSDGLQGGGDYDDDDITDETYWAAAELYLTTGEKKYLSALRSSPFWAGAAFSEGGAFDWRNVAGLARLDLALYGNNLRERDRGMIRDSVVSAARNFLSLQQKEPFGHIYRPGVNGYAWGSNHLVLQNMIVLSAGYDLTGERGFLDGVRESMDYLLGRNAMNISYVTGYGSNFAKNQHSRWYAHQLDARLPHPPAGSLAGGPNATLVDDVAKARLTGCAPQTCYVDDIMSWGTNEITINWNAPLLYIASFLADAR